MIVYWDNLESPAKYHSKDFLEETKLYNSKPLVKARYGTYSLTDEKHYWLLDHNAEYYLTIEFSGKIRTIWMIDIKPKEVELLFKLTWL